MMKKTYVGPRSSLHLVLLVGAMTFSVIGGVSAAMVSVSFAPNSNYEMGASELAGAPGVRMDHWNSVSGGVTATNDLVNDSGLHSGIDFSITSYNSSGRGTATSNDDKMFRGTIDVRDATGETIRISGISYNEYDVYVYMYDDRSTRAGSFTIGSTTYYMKGYGTAEGDIPSSDGSGYVLSTDTTVDLSNPGTVDVENSVDAGNYVKFSSLSGSSFDLIVGALQTSDAADRNKVAGFQVVQVPEPATFGLVGLFGGAIFLIRRTFRV